MKKKVIILTLLSMGIGACIYGVVDASIQLYKLNKGTHDFDKGYKMGYEAGKLMGRLEEINDNMKAFIDKHSNRVETESEEVIS